MKKGNVMLSVALGALLMTSCAKEKQQRVELPDLAKLFVSQNFNGQEVLSVSNDSAAVYDVTLADKTQIEFNTDGMWQKIKPEDADSVPSKVLPMLAVSYLEDIYPGKKIKMAERNIPTGLMRVTLDGGLQIVFTSEGQVAQ